MRKKYVVRLTDGERDRLKDLIAAGAAPARLLLHARILLKADAGWADERTAEAVEVSQPTIARVRRISTRLRGDPRSTRSMRRSTRR